MSRLHKETREALEEKQTRMLMGTIVKGAMVISASVVLVLWGHSCQLKTETIQECKSACNSRDSQMASVTNQECVCEKTPDNNWVLPKSR